MLGEQLRWAAGHGFTARVRLLLEHGVDPRSPGYHADHGDLTAVELAVAHGHREAADLLAEVGGASDRIDDVDRLISAALAADRAGVERLQDASPGRADVVATLLAAGADPTLRDERFDATPSDWAAHAGHHALADDLRR
jgi:ankyrin repeat protein